jgi:hypothetical protein
MLIYVKWRLNFVKRFDVVYIFIDTVLAWASSNPWRPS